MDEISYWAKTDNGRHDGEPSVALLTHLTHTGLAAKALITGNAIAAQAHAPATLGIALHDIGKASAGFANQCDIWRELYGQPTNGQKLVTDHKLIGAIILRWELGLPLWLVKAIASHHGRLITDSAPGARAVYAEGGSVKDIFHLLPSLPVLATREQTRNGSIFPTKKWNGLVEALSARTGIAWPAEWSAELSSTQVWLLMGLCVISDWVASSIHGEAGEYLQPKRLDECQADIDCMLKTLQLREPVKMLETVNSFEALTGKPPRACQQIEYHGPGLYVIEAPTGAGKTEIAIDLTRQLIQDGHARGLFFTLPTRISSKEIFSRIQKLLDGKTDATVSKLVHSTSWLEEVNFQPISFQNPTDAQERGRWLDGRRKGLLSPIGAGPLDQVLLAFVRSRFFFLRLWALQQKVIVIDELHSYSAYMLQLLAQAMPVLKEMGCTLIVLSATLTQRAKQDLFEASGLTNETLPDRTSNSQSMHVDLEGRLSVQTLDTGDCTAYPAVQVHKHLTPLDVGASGYRRAIDEAIIHALAGEKVLWIVNTVRAAQAVYAHARAARVNVPVGLIHSRFTATDRRQHEKKWLEFFAKEKGGCLLVGTQVLEQSIDLDSDRLFTELAPIDLIIQRAGRLWRKTKAGRLGPAPLHVLLPVSQESADFGGGWRVYENHFELLRAQRILPDSLDKNQAWELLELDAEPETAEEAELMAAYREQVKAELMLAIARGVSMEDVVMEDDEDEAPRQDDPDESDRPVVRLVKVPTTRVCIMRDDVTFWDGSERQADDGLSPRQIFELRRAVELNVVTVPTYCFTLGSGTIWDRDTRTQSWILGEAETWGGLCYNSELGAFPA
jgi:CRISPR-associated helicase Cas3/CRISPR-associated endonuclease Cas3-HD